MITVFLPSRRRYRPLLESLTSVLAMCDGPRQILVAIDPDETYPDTRGITFWRAPERYGYSRQHEYYNGMLPLAQGDWLFLWGDDARMRSNHWDRLINAHAPNVLWPQSNGYRYCFPIVPAAWAHALGRFSPSAHPDSYWYSVGKGLDRHVEIPVSVFHDRKDLTGGHDDQTYAEGRGLLGQTGMADDGGAEIIGKDVEVLRRLL